MAARDFVEQLRALGYNPREPAAGLVEIDHQIPVGPRTGERIRLAFAIPPDFPLQPPSGPCVSPPLLPLHPDQSVGHPIGGVHPAPQLDENWQYWSRPFPGWQQTDRTVRAYMAHIRHLFATL
jgi:hypothetical protein